MTRLVIAVDCDDVLINTTEYFMSQYNQRYGTLVALENAYRHDDPSFNATRDQIYERFNVIANSDEFGRLIPRADAVCSIRRLARSHELHLLTARQALQERATVRMLNEYFLNSFTEAHYLHQDSKGEMCKTLGADVIIDDNAKHLAEAKRCGIKERIWFGSYPWQMHDELFDGFTSRAANWNEVEKIVDQLTLVRTGVLQGD
jgi:5'(3')-deoxyribonucleotidase